MVVIELTPPTRDQQIDMIILPDGKYTLGKPNSEVKYDYSKYTPKEIRNIKECILDYYLRSDFWQQTNAL